MIIFGIDPSLNSCGYCILSFLNNSLNLLDIGTIKAKPGGDFYQKLNIIHKILKEVSIKFQPNILAMEETFVNSNAKTSLKLGIVRGICISSVIESNKIEILEYEPRLIKKTLTGNGSADKNQIDYIIKQILPKANHKTDDESDAIAVAVTAYIHKTTNLKLT